jgi:hypothetical protein
MWLCIVHCVKKEKLMLWLKWSVRRVRIKSDVWIPVALESHLVRDCKCRLQLFRVKLNWLLIKKHSWLSRKVSRKSAFNNGSLFAKIAQLSWKYVRTLISAHFLAKVWLWACSGRVYLGGHNAVLFTPCSAVGEWSWTSQFFCFCEHFASFR